MADDKKPKVKLNPEHCDLVPQFRHRELARLVDRRIREYNSWGPRTAAEGEKPERILEQLRSKRLELARTAPKPIVNGARYLTRGLHEHTLAHYDRFPFQYAPVAVCVPTKNVTTVTRFAEFPWDVSPHGDDTVFSYYIDNSWGNVEFPMEMVAISSLTDQTHVLSQDSQEMMQFGGVFEIPIPARHVEPPSCRVKVRCELDTSVFMSTSYSAELGYARGALISRIIDPDNDVGSSMSSFSWDEPSDFNPFNEGQSDRDKIYIFNFELNAGKRALLQFGLSLMLVCREGYVTVGYSGLGSLRINPRQHEPDGPSGIRYWLSPA